MTAAALLAAAHYLGAMLLFGCLLAEHMLLAPQLPLERMRRLARIDALFGLASGIQIATGVGRMFMEKGEAFYLHNPLFHAKLTVFVLIGLLSIYPTVRILRWHRAAREAGQVAPAAAEYRRVLMIVRLELVLILLLPVLASLMARGVGMR
ncbi:DUF2214 family protein [Chitinimonas koreensis]|uniref:DUF2214 family protein n=1 Tax=Chitinimonas koreensis TaxID=356302 RepID=UPI000417E443|nr:DUF2214 family protein [Chitinimonas koreensis]QNM97093.1 DUF2214 family protein [Chitinimonas koreensis]